MDAQNPVGGHHHGLLAAAAYWALLKSDDFKKWPGSIAFGVAFGLGMMHKWSFFTYMAPAAYVALGAAPFSTGTAGTRPRSRPSSGSPAACRGTRHPPADPRAQALLEASADYGVLSGRGAAFFQYLESRQRPGRAVLPHGLVRGHDPGLHALQEALVGHPRLAHPFLSVWAVVPNRQMRFLLPGLIPLGVGLGIAALPKVVVWSPAAVQIVLALNFATG